MKKILIFSLNYYPKFIGGAEVAIKEIVERVNPPARLGEYEFHMLTLRFDKNLPKYEVIHGIHIYRIGFSKKGATIGDLKKFPLRLNHYFYQIFGGIFAIRLHLQNKYDAVWSMMPTSTGVPMSFLKLFTFDKIKSIVTFQEGDPIPYMMRKILPGLPFFYYAVRSADVVQTISTFLLNWARELGYKGYGVVIPNGVDVEKFTKNISHEEIENIKNKIGKKQGEIWLATTSRLVHKNGIDDCINALKMLPEKYHFLIMGIGPDEIKLKKLVEDLNLQNRIHFAGEVKHPEIVLYLKACDIFIRPSRSEGMGNSFVEAFALRLPVVATTEGGLSDLIFDNQTAFVCQKDNPESVVQAVKKIENTSYLDMENILNNAEKLAREKFDWQLIAERMQSEVFEKI